MVSNILAIGEMEKWMVVENKFSRKAMSMKANIKMDCLMVLHRFSIKVEVAISVNLSIIQEMVLVFTPLQVEISILEYRQTIN